MKKGAKLLIFLEFLVIIVLLLLIFNPESIIKFTGNLIKEDKIPVTFYFYDENSNCPLNGYLFLNDNLIGKTNKGYFNLNYEDYLPIYDKKGNISLFGILGDCFDSEMYFHKYWDMPILDEDYFLQNSLFNFKTKIVLNNPHNKEFLSFVDSKGVKEELDSIALTNQVLDDLTQINNYLNKKIKYVKDWDFNNENNYWQTPKQTFSLMQGDCEDYSTTLLSLFLAYNNSLNCYNIIFTSHVTTFCKIDKYYVYYDQEKTELKKEINYRTVEERKVALEKLKDEYFNHYGINDSETAGYAFNDKEYFRFSNNAEFIDSLEQEYFWQSPDNKGKPLVEQEPKEELAGELHSASPELLTEKPSISGFFKQYVFIIIPLIAILLILICLLTIVVKKKELKKPLT